MMVRFFVPRTPTLTTQETSTASSKHMERKNEGGKLFLP
jgi:hypothetical protein